MSQYSVLTGITFLVIILASLNFCLSANRNEQGSNKRLRPSVKNKHGTKSNHKTPTFIIVKNDHESSSCPVPSFSDDNVQFFVNECQQRKKDHSMCQGGKTTVPSDWTGTMTCINGGITVKFSSTCAKNGQWQPSFFNNCADLLQQSMKRFPETVGSPPPESLNQHTNFIPGHKQQEHYFPPQPDVVFINEDIQDKNAIPCFKLQVQKDARFAYSCKFPGVQEEVEDCGTESSVVSGTQAFLKCKPPYKSQNHGGNFWLCENGIWIEGSGSSNSLICFQTIHSVNRTPPGSQFNEPTQSIPAQQYPYQQFISTQQPFLSPTTSYPTSIAPQPTRHIVVDTAESHRKNQTNWTPGSSNSHQGDMRQSLGTGTESSMPIIDLPAHQNSTFENSTTKIPHSPVSTPSPHTMCPPLFKKLPGLRIECVFLKNQVSTSSCKTRVPVGSEARYSCDEFYEPTMGRTTLFRKCKEDGTWSGSGQQFACAVQCGRGNGIRVPFITRGQPTLRGQWPWNTAIFVNESRTATTKLSFICGGSLISQKALVTAAHCVTEYQSTTVRHSSTFRVDLGKYNLHDEDDIVQSRKIAKVVVHPSYSPYGYDSDIAILIFSTPIKISYHVRPICYPQMLDSAMEEFQLSEGSPGTVAGWGKNESGNLSETLQMTVLPVVNSRTCHENVQDAFVTQLQSRSTTYCAGHGNGTNVCNGDSGSGMYFPSNKDGSTRWYLQGIVSVGIPDSEGNCDPTKYSIFTRVGRYADFIVRTLSEEDAN